MKVGIKSLKFYLKTAKMTKEIKVLPMQSYGQMNANGIPSLAVTRSALHNNTKDKKAIEM